MTRRRHNFTAEFKAQVVLELLAGEKSVAEASRAYRIKDTVLSRWKQEFVERAAQVSEPAQELQERERRIAELGRMLGQLTHQLRRAPYGYRINRKRVQRLLRPVKRVQCRTTDSQHPYPRYPNLVKALSVTHPEQVWACDITFVRLANGFVYLAVILDGFTRAIRGWNLGRDLDTPLTLTALRGTLAGHVPEIHHSDQGVQYAAQEYVDVLNEHHIQISMAAVGKAEENGYAERVVRTIKEEEVNLSEYRDFADAHQQIGHFIEDVYLTKRIHSALGYLTPAEFEAA